MLESTCPIFCCFCSDCNTDKIYEELVWESLYHRRYYMRMTLFYKIIVNECTPEYLRTVINQAQVKPYSFRNSNVLEPINYPTNRFASSFYRFCVTELNNLESSLRALPSISQFKTAIIRIIRPPKRSIHHLSDIPGCKLLTRLHLDFSELREHKFRHNFNCIESCVYAGMG